VSVLFPLLKKNLKSLPSGNLSKEENLILYHGVTI
jgi:hypothetical protein